MKILFQALILGCLLASRSFGAEVSDDLKKFVVHFPEGSGWSDVVKKSPVKEATHWASTNKKGGMATFILIGNAPALRTLPTFRERALDWERGMLSRESEKVSAQFSKLAGKEAYHIITSARINGTKVYFSSWYVESGGILYTLGVVAPSKELLEGKDAKAFISSFSINEK